MTTRLIPEEWRVIPSWPWYAASSLGRIRREVGGGRAVAGRVLRPCIAGQFKAYLGVRLWNSDKNTGHTVNVANLVAAAFLGPRELGMEINHKNGVKTDNSVANLEYVTKRQQEDHAVAMGLHPQGMRHHSAKLTDAQVREIRERVGKERDLALIYGVSPSVIHNIRARKTWRHVA